MKLSILVRLRRSYNGRYWCFNTCCVLHCIKQYNLYVSHCADSISQIIIKGQIMDTGFITTSLGKTTHRVAYNKIELLPIVGAMSWGHLYQSSYNTALTILMHAFGNRKKAERLARRFRREVVSELYFDCSWSMSPEEIQRWATNTNASFIPSMTH